MQLIQHDVHVLRFKAYLAMSRHRNTLERSHPHHAAIHGHEMHVCMPAHGTLDSEQRVGSARIDDREIGASDSNAWRRGPSPCLNDGDTSSCLGQGKFARNH